MNLVVLGSGTSVPHPRRAASAFWLHTHAGTLLLDAGADAAHRLAQEGLPWDALDAIWISHFHLDHIGGLASLLFGMKYAPQTQERRKLLTIIGPQGLREVVERFDAAHEYDLLKQPFPVHVREVASGEEFEMLPDLHATTRSTPHTEESLALRLRVAPLSSDSSEDTPESGTMLCYTSDTGDDAELSEFARGADLLIIEASFRDAKPVETHLNLAEAIHIARRAESACTILTHMYPEWDGTSAEVEAAKLWAGLVLEGRDGLRLAFDTQSVQVISKDQDQQ